MFRHDEIFFGRATGIGNPVIYVGAKTGRDGIKGASMASAEFDEDSKDKRPNVQVGDPFMEKLLLEACLEAMHTGAVVGIQDMGAAGLTCSTCEMGSRAETGIEIDLALVPQRETGMTPYEIMLSESQERMLIVAEKGREDEVFAVFKKWGLDAVTIGRVTDDGMLRVKDHGKVVAEIPNRELADEAPLYDRPHDVAPYRPAPVDAPATFVSRSRDLNGGSTERWSARAICVRSAGSGSNTITWFAPIRLPVRAAMPRSSASRRPAPASRCRSTATGAIARSIPREGAKLHGRRVLPQSFDGRRDAGGGDQ